MLRRCLTVLALLFLLAAPTLSHKDAPEVGGSDYSYYINLGIVPGIVLEGEEQQIYLRIEDYYDRSPVSGLRARFIVYRDLRTDLESSDKLYTHDYSETILNAEGEEEEPGIYVARHTFEEKGNYILKATLYEGRNTIKEIQRNVAVEPNGPSTVFWLYMLTAVLVGGFVASRSDRMV